MSDQVFRAGNAKLGVLVALVATVVATVLPPTGHARSMQLGYFDPAFNTPVADIRMAEAARDGARIARIVLSWAQNAPARPADGSNPSDPAYQWASADAAVRSAVAHGLRPLLSIEFAPPWAEGPHRPADADHGSWKPDPRFLGQFGAAAAKHFSGRVAGVPRVRLWQVWNEPNLSAHLGPQYENGNIFAASHYRRMLNAFYAGVKSVDRGGTVLTAGTAPYGDAPGGSRTRPVAFWRALLCLGGKTLRRLPCSDPAHFDAWAHHPYGVSGPRQHAINADDVAIPDLGRIARVVRVAVRKKRALPSRAKRAWVTEFSWDSSPPDPNGVPVATHARWLEGALYEFWREGVTTALWFQVRDQAPEPSYGATYQSGTRQSDGAAKPAERAYRFPFATGRPGPRTQVWGLAPRAGRLRVQTRTGGAWRTVARPRASSGRVFTARVKTRRGPLLRAKLGSATSLTWRVGRDG